MIMNLFQWLVLLALAFVFGGIALILWSKNRGKNTHMPDTVRKYLGLTLLLQKRDLNWRRKFNRVSYLLKT